MVHVKWTARPLWELPHQGSQASRAIPWVQVEVSGIGRIRQETKSGTQSTNASARMDNTRLNCSPTILSIATTSPNRASLSLGRLAFSPEEVTRCSYRDIGRIAGVMGGLDFG
ncbi:hypothetical protein OPQ81_010642 [Rhizoctonia solani]|nr:hypothetical protein OPQ81_010642 [Rhizoctonia solani]